MAISKKTKRNLMIMGITMIVVMATQVVLAPAIFYFLNKCACAMFGEILSKDGLYWIAASCQTMIFCASFAMTVACFSPID